MIVNSMGPLFRFVVGDRRAMAFYDWDVAVQGGGRADPDVVEWPPGTPLSAGVERQLRRQGVVLARWRMRRKWQSGEARLFTLMCDGFPAALGTTQTWRTVRPQLYWLGEPGVLLGPYWTDPDYRGRGIYGRLLMHTVHVLATEGTARLYVWAATQNLPSRKGIERAGFRPRGCFLLRRRLCRTFCRAVPLPHEPATVASSEPAER